MNRPANPTHSNTRAPNHGRRPVRPQTCGLARASAVRAERFSLASLAVRVIDIAHREPVGHVLLQIGKHRGIFLGNKDCEGPSISGDKSYDEIAVLRSVDVDHCTHVITRSLALSEPSLFDDARVAS